MRIDRKYKPVEYNYSNDIGLEKAYVRQPSLVDEFYITENKCPETGETTHQISHPLYMLFNQERLDRLGPSAVQQWLQSLDSAGSSSLEELKSKVSDEDMLSMVKSRHIQHPCELERYISQLNERADFFNSEVARVLNEQKLAQEKAVQEQQGQPVEVTRS